MIRQTKLLLLCVAICMLQVKCADKYTDQNKPYEFGFTIDGEQHRHEKKDENGIIMGEFGFITADGVYHVTVYATDENGGFKILSMKNIRVRPYPTAKVGAEKGRSLEFSPSPQLSIKSVAPVLSKSPQAPLKLALASPAKSCSHCSLPTTTTTTTTTTEEPNNFNTRAYQKPSISQEPDVLPKYDKEQQNYSQQSDFSSPHSSPQQQHREQYSQQFDDQQSYPKQNVGSAQKYPQPGQYGTAENNPQKANGQNHQIGSSVSQSYPENIQQTNYPQQESDNGPNYPQSRNSNQYQEQNLQSGINRNPKSYEKQSEQQQKQQHIEYNTGGTSSDQPQENSQANKPQLISAQMQLVDKNTDINYKRPGEQEGLPKGLTKDDMTQLLYTFNYTVGFQGHFEEGYRNGAKQGYYYVTGRNGVRTRIDYVADEHGFRPKITQDVLDLLSDDVPKPETEKDAKYGLKGYEFKWIYYPVDSKQR